MYALLLSAPATTLLVTSRSALRLRGEHEFPVPPLELPSETAAMSPDDIARWPATALFWERAQAIMPDLKLDDGNAAVVADICRKLDGLPLAIELAAARVKHLPLDAVRDQLEHRLQLLVGGPLDLPLRQRAIRDTVAWSHDLLGEEETRLFRRLPVFSGGWDLAAVESVCGSPSEIGEALGGVSSLVDQSLVVLDRSYSSARYRMLDVVRDYAAQELLTAGEAEVIERRHALNYLVMSEEAGPNLMRAGHQEWFARLDVERGNLRRAMAWAIKRGETELALRYSVALWRYWRQLGEFVEGRRWSEAAVGLPGEAPSSLRAKALGAAAALAWPQGDYDRMAALSAEAIDLARQSEDPMDLRDAVTVKGMVAMGQGRYAEAVERFRETIAICRPLGLSWQLATSHLNLGTALVLSSPEEAEATLTEGLDMYRQLVDDIFAARMTNGIAYAALARNEIDRADSLARIALAAFAEQSERQGVAQGLETLAAVAAARGEAERAGTLGGAAAAVRETIAARAAQFEVAVTGLFMERIHEAADEELWRGAWEAGLAMGADAAVAYALE